MNPHPRLPLVSTTLLICLTVVPPIVAQRPGTAGLYGHTATLLANGQLLVVGGNIGNYYTPTASAELYNPATGQWSLTGRLSAPRARHSAVRLANGKVLVTGGLLFTGGGATTFFITAEIYDPDTGAWSPTGHLSVARACSSATLLADGRVLVAGGWGPDDANIYSAELYDPATGAWSLTGSMNSARSCHTATLLASGQVLVASGYNNSGSRSSDLYDPSTGNWTAVTDLIAAPDFTEAILLRDRQVLVAGGAEDEGDRCVGVANSELYDAETGQRSITGNLNIARAYHSLTLLANGTVLAAAGVGSDCNSVNSSELYDPVARRWYATGSLNSAREEHTATLLANGKVLVVGGYGSTNNAELYDPATGRWSIPDAPTVTYVSAASLAAGGSLAPESIASAIGTNLAIATEAAPPGFAPIQLAGASVKVRDGAGMERLAPLFSVSPAQINYLVPSGTAAGLATVTVTSGGSFVAAALVSIAGVAPGLFSANSSGQGVAAGFWIRVAEGGSQSYDYLFDLTTRKSVPLDLGLPGDQLFLSLYGTGFRGGTGTVATVGGVRVAVSAFAPVTGYPGLDVVNVGPLPRSLAGRAEVDVAFFVDGKTANPVSINIR